MDSSKSYKKSRPKVLKDWTDEDMYKLIQLVEECRPLWDKQILEYKQPKEILWEEISDAFGGIYPPQECKAKWSGLRVTFNASLSKYRNINVSQDDDREKRKIWRFFEPMSFLGVADNSQTRDSSKVMIVAEREWSIDDTYKLIQLIEARNPIWDRACAEYTESKGHLWNEIGEEFEKQYSVAECKDKWANLRITFKVILAKSSKHTDHDNNIQWRYFEALKFLEPTDVPLQPTIPVDLLDYIPSHEIISFQDTEISIKRWRPKVLSVWSDSDVYKLIELVEERPALWDKDRPEYKKPKDFLWQEVVELFDEQYSLEECKAKWANLRVSFNTNLAKQSVDKNKTIHWRFYESMIFLAPEKLRRCLKKNKPIIKKEWREEDINKLIKLVQARTPLWQKQNEAYKQPKDYLWQEIVESIKRYSLSECKSKWVNLYVSFHTNKEKGTDGENDNAKYYKDLMFLDSVKTRTTAKKYSTKKLRKTKKRLKKKRAKVKNVWSDDDIHKLIKFVEERSRISDQHPEDCVWQEIVGLFNEKYSMSECRAKWESLPEYHNSRQGYEGQEKTNDDNDVPQAIEIMSPLRLSSAENENSNDVIIVEEDYKSDDNNEVDLSEIVPLVPNIEMSDCSDTASTSNSQIQSRTLPATSKRRRLEYQIVEDVGTTSNDHSKFGHKKDNFCIFGEYVASELRYLRNSPDLQHKLKQFIQQKIIDVTSEHAQRFLSKRQFQT